MWQYKHASGYHSNILSFFFKGNWLISLWACKMSEPKDWECPSPQPMPSPSLLSSWACQSQHWKKSPATAVLNAWGMRRLRQHALQIALKIPRCEWLGYIKLKRNTPHWLGHQWEERISEVVLQIERARNKTKKMYACVCVYNTAMR